MHRYFGGDLVKRDEAEARWCRNRVSHLQRRVKGMRKTAHSYEHSAAGLLGDELFRPPATEASKMHNLRCVCTCACIHIYVRMGMFMVGFDTEDPMKYDLCLFVFFAQF